MIMRDVYYLMYISVDKEEKVQYLLSMNEEVPSTSNKIVDLPYAARLVCLNCKYRAIFKHPWNRFCCIIYR